MALAPLLLQSRRRPRSPQRPKPPLQPVSYASPTPSEGPGSPCMWGARLYPAAPPGLSGPAENLPGKTPRTPLRLAGRGRIVHSPLRRGRRPDAASEEN